MFRILLFNIIVLNLMFVLYLLMSTPSIASPPLFCRAKLYNLLFISRFRMQPSNVPVVSRKCAVFEKCPSGDPSTTGNANVILEKSPYKVNEIQNKLNSTMKFNGLPFIPAYTFYNLLYFTQLLKICRQCFQRFSCFCSTFVSHKTGCSGVFHLKTFRKWT